jgi:lysophospholipase L1-like esterase
MKRSIHARLGALIALSALVAGCQGPCSKLDRLGGPQVLTGTVDFSSYVAVGTSISAGFQSGGLVNRHQVRSFPAIFAQQVGKTVSLSGQGTFSLPVFDGDGAPPLLHIVSYSPLIIQPSASPQGNPVNVAQPTPYHNLAVPGALAFDFADASLYYLPARGNPYFAAIIRQQGTIEQNALALAPTFMTFEFGANEVLGPTIQGGAAAVTTAEQFIPAVDAELDALHAADPGLRIAIFNVPDVTSIPFVTTLSPFTRNATTGAPLPLIGAGGLLQQGDFLTLNASTLIATTGTGIPTTGINYLNPSVPGNGQPLPESVILRAGEAAQTRYEIAQMNDALLEESRRPYVALVDLNGLLRTIATTGLTIGQNHYTKDFVQGGLFSLDGIHPNDLAHAVICNTLIDAVNAKFGAGLQRVDPLAFATPSSSAVLPIP